MCRCAPPPDTANGTGAHNAQRDIANNRLVQVVDNRLEGSDDFYLLSRRQGNSPSALKSVIHWVQKVAQKG